MITRYHVPGSITTLVFFVLISSLLPLPVLGEEAESDTIPPVPIFDLQEQQNEDSNPLLIDGSLSYDPDSNQDLTYVWSVMLGTENIPIATIGNGSKINLSVDKAGTYSIRLTVYDGSLNSASLERSIRIIDSNPVVEANFGNIKITQDSIIVEPEELGPWEITAYATNTGDEDRIVCEWYMESEIWLQGCRHVIHEWPLGDRDERVATLIVIDNDGSQSSTQFIFTQQDDTSDDTLVFLLLSILTLLLVSIIYKNRRSNFTIPKWSPKVSETDHILK